MAKFARSFPKTQICRVGCGAAVITPLGVAAASKTAGDQDMKSLFTMTRLPYVTFWHLCEIGDEGIKWNYNRQLNSDYIRQHVPSHSRFLVIQHFEHYYRHMLRCEPHMRLVIEMGDGLAIADVPMAYFRKLPRAFFVKRGRAVVLMVLFDQAGNPVAAIKKGPMGQVEQAINHLARETGIKSLARFIRQEFRAIA
jgi:hypothetical protein